MPEKPFWLVNVIVVLLEEPSGTISVGVDVPTVKSPVTVIMTRVLWTSEPIVPVTLIMYVPGVAASADIDSFDSVEPPVESVIVLGQRETTGPEGESDTAREIAPDRLRLASVTLEVADALARTIETEDGLAVIVKSMMFNRMTA